MEDNRQSPQAKKRSLTEISRAETDKAADETIFSAAVQGKEVSGKETPTTATTSGDDQPLSKKQKKRILKMEKLKAKKAKKKEEKRAKAIAAGRDLDAERRFQEERTASGHRKRWLEKIWKNEKLPLAQKSFQICLDCSFESLMQEREIASLAQQIRYCYSYNKRSPNPSLVGVTDIHEDNETLELLKKEAGFPEWGNRLFTVTEKSLPEYYSSQLSIPTSDQDKDTESSAQDWASKAVYLTSDSPNVIEKLDNDKIYVIGGIVDRNRLKRKAIDRAEALGVAHGKLPLEDHLAKMTSTKVLTCNHVFHILLKFREHGDDWAKALQDVLPTRKEATFKGDKA